MKEKLTPRWFIIKLTGILFAIYSAYNIFLIVRDGSAMPPVGIFISALVSLLFALLAAFAWTSEVKNVRFMECPVYDDPQDRDDHCFAHDFCTQAAFGKQGYGVT